MNKIWTVAWVVVIAAAGLMGLRANAGHYDWDAGGGASTDWNIQANWNPEDAIPGVGDTVDFSRHGTLTVTLSTDHTVDKADVTGTALWTWTGAGVLNCGTGGFWHAGPYDNESNVNTLNNKLSGSGGLHQYGGYRVRLTNPNSDFTGDVYIEEGIVHCNAGEASETPLTSLGNAANTIYLGSNRSFGTLWSDRASSPEINYPIALGKAGGMLVGHTDYFEGLISGTGPLVVGPRYRAYFRNLSADNTYSGGTRVYSTFCYVQDSQKVFGTGDMRIANGGTISLQSSNNLDSAAVVALDGPPPGFASNSLTYGPSILVLAADFMPTISADSEGLLCVDGSSGANINAALAASAPTLGNGKMWIGSHPTYGNGTFTGDSLQCGSDGVYRFASYANGYLYLDRSGSYNGVLTGAVDVVCSADAVGEPGSVEMRDMNTFTGTLRVTDHARVRGYTYDTGNALGDTNGPVELMSGTLEAVRQYGTDKNVTKGDLTFEGQNKLLVNTSTDPVALRVKSLTRQNRGMLQVHPYQGNLATLEKFFVTDGVTVNNGMVAPWLIESQEANFLTYDGTVGFTQATYTATTLAGAGAGSIVNVTAAEAVPAGKTVYALRTTANITGANTLTNTSGGLILAAAGVDIQAPIDFGSAEGMISYEGDCTISGTITATNGITIGICEYYQPDKLTLTADNTSTLEGQITVNWGQLLVNSDAALGHADNVVYLNGGPGGDGGKYSGALRPISAPTIYHPIELGPNGGALISEYGAGGGNMYVESKISGTGLLYLKTGHPNIRIEIKNTANDYSGGTCFDTGSYYIYGALGTGPVTMRNCGMRLYNSNAVHRTAAVTLGQTEYSYTRLRLDDDGMFRFGSLSGAGWNIWFVGVG